MDFDSLMSAHISKKPPKKTSATNSSSTTTTTTAIATLSEQSNNTKKYLKRSEVESARLAAYAADQAALDSARASKLERKRKADEEAAQREIERAEKKRRLAAESARLKAEEEREEEQARRKRLGLPPLPSVGSDGDGEGTTLPEGVEDIDDEELVAKLRDMDEPATMFGETHARRLIRYLILTGVLDSDGTKKVTMTDGPIPTSLVLLPEKDMQIPPTPPPASDTAARALLFRQLASYFTMILIAWDRALSSRDASVKTSYAGKAAYNAFLAARDNMRPLFRRLEKGDLESGILDPVVAIVRAAQERRYVDANDGYLTLSIGKAAWPIGVTMVGIHERSAREKLHESDKGAAHIMSDEVTRKWLQSIKRCLSFAQTRWPPEDVMQLMG